MHDGKDVRSPAVDRSEAHTPERQSAPGRRPRTAALAARPATAAPPVQRSVAASYRPLPVEDWTPVAIRPDRYSRPIMRKSLGEVGSLAPSHPIQADTGAIAQQAAARGFSQGGGQLPHLGAIQTAFGAHDVSGVQAHVAGSATEACADLGASAYASGNHVAFASQPDLHTAAHEAAHVVQQRGGVQLKGGVGEVGDRYERHADAVADRVVRGESAESLLSSMAGPGGASDAPVQLLAVPGNTFGGWNIEQSVDGGGTAGAAYSSEIVIDFNPNAKTVNSPEIAFVQDVAVLDTGGSSVDPRDNFKNRATDEGHTIDRVDNKKHGWYGYDNDGSASGVLDKKGNFASGNISPGSAPTPVKSAKMYDKPGWNKANTSWKFEAYAISKSGPQANKLYGGLKWGFDVDGSNTLTKHTPTHLDKATAQFDASVEAWNKQAAGDASKRNHADQQALGPFS